MSDVLKRLDAMESALQAKGFPAMSEWWGSTLARFYRSGRRQCVLRVGRRGGKSSNLCRVGVAEALFGNHKITPGDVGVVAIISVSRDEAAQRLRTIKAILDALDIKYRPVEGGIELADRPIAFKTFAATVAGVVGFTAIAVLCDEVARWRDAESGANPAKEVLASLRPTMATMPSARLFLSSSPLSNDDAHAAAYDTGETDFQIVAHAPTWIANPTISEADTHALEPSERIHKREYGALPGDAVAAVWSEELIGPVFVKPPWAYRPYSPPVVLTDPSGLSGRDKWAACVAQFMGRHYAEEDLIEWTVKLDQNRQPLPGQRTPLRDANGGIVLKAREAQKPPFLLITRLGQWASPFTSSVSGDEVCRQIAMTANSISATGVCIDQYASAMVAGSLERHGARYRAFTHSNTSKREGVEFLTRLMGERRLKIIDDASASNVADFKSEMRTFQEKLGGGLSRFEARSGRHDDWVSLLLLAARASDDGLFGAGAPYAGPTGRGNIAGIRQSGGVRSITDEFTSNV